MEPLCLLYCTNPAISPSMRFVASDPAFAHYHTLPNHELSAGLRHLGSDPDASMTLESVAFFSNQQLDCYSIVPRRPDGHL